MLTISEVAQKFNLSNRQVHDMVSYGFLNVAGIHRHSGRGPTYLFSEHEVNNLDVHLVLQEIEHKKRSYAPGPKSTSEFRRVIRVLNYYDRFMDSVHDHPQEHFLTICFYLFHLNHYAKRYQDRSDELYRLKNQVLRKLYKLYSEHMQAIYLLGPDRKRIWLCDDCKESASAAGMSYVEYLKKGYYCPKCSVNSVEKEYYSLVEFRIALEDFRFTFHLPRSAAIRWMENLEELPQSTRDTGNYTDCMYLYGRTISRIEERILPLPLIQKKLQQFLIDSED